MFLLQNPEALEKAQFEVDPIFGTAAIKVTNLRQLRYNEAVLRETLRLSSTAPRLRKTTHSALRHATIVPGGKFKIEPDDLISILLGKSMQDPALFSEDAKDFKLERMLDDNPNFPDLQQYCEVRLSPSLIY